MPDQKPSQSPLVESISNDPSHHRCGLDPGNECPGDDRVGQDRDANSNVIPAFIAGIQAMLAKTANGDWS